MEGIGLPPGIPMMPHFFREGANSSLADFVALNSSNRGRNLLMEAKELQQANNPPVAILQSDKYLTIVYERRKFASATSKREEGFPFFASSNLDISSGDDSFVTACEELDNTILNISTGPFPTGQQINPVPGICKPEPLGIRFEKDSNDSSNQKKPSKHYSTTAQTDFKEPPLILNQKPAIQNSTDLQFKKSLTANFTDKESSTKFSRQKRFLEDSLENFNQSFKSTQGSTNFPQCSTPIPNSFLQPNTSRFRNLSPIGRHSLLDESVDVSMMDQSVDLSVLTSNLGLSILNSMSFMSDSGSETLDSESMATDLSDTLRRRFNKRHKSVRHNMSYSVPPSDFKISDVVRQVFNTSKAVHSNLDKSNLNHSNQNVSNYDHHPSMDISNFVPPDLDVSSSVHPKSDKPKDVHPAHTVNEGRQPVTTESNGEFRRPYLPFPCDESHRSTSRRQSKASASMARREYQPSSSRQSVGESRLNKSSKNLDNSILDADLDLDNLLVFSTSTRVPYSREENDALIKGLKKYGPDFKKILSVNKSVFHPKRTRVSLYDKWRRDILPKLKAKKSKKTESFVKHEP